MEFQIKIIGVILIILGCIHVIFPKYFDWKSDLVQLQLINQSLLKVHTFFIALTVFLMGLLCLTSAKDLLQTQLGNRICFGFGFFWLVRLFFQFFVYPSALWRGKKLETTIHIFASFFWTYLAVTFLNAYFTANH